VDPRKRDEELFIEIPKCIPAPAEILTGPRRHTVKISDDILSLQLAEIFDSDRTGGFVLSLNL
jgi:hypothetical protein